MADAAHAVGVAADGLRPQAEGAARFAAAAGVERDVRVQQITAEIILDGEIALVDRGDERQFIHVVQDRPLLVVDDAARSIAVGQPLDAGEVAALGHLLDGEVELVAADEVELFAGLQAAGRIDRALSASAVRTSEENEGVDVCITTRSRLVASGATSSNLSRCGGASISFEPSTKAAGCASQVGYQNDLTSRRI